MEIKVSDIFCERVFNVRDKDFKNGKYEIHYKRSYREYDEVYICITKDDETTTKQRKEPDIPEGYTLADGRIVDKK